jgi:hypothetical protein
VRPTSLLRAAKGRLNGELGPSAVPSGLAPFVYRQPRTFVLGYFQTSLRDWTNNESASRWRKGDRWASPIVFVPRIRISCTGLHQHPRVRLSLRKAAWSSPTPASSTGNPEYAWANVGHPSIPSGRGYDTDSIGRFREPQRGLPVGFKSRQVESCGIPHLAKNERDAPNFLYAAPDKTACAPFFKERRMRFAEPTKLHRKSGMSGTLSSVATSIPEPRNFVAS